jgi:class 3 adenylate cyclase
MTASSRAMRQAWCAAASSCDISPAIGERMRLEEFHAFLQGFYRIASDVILRHDGLVDRFVG